MANKKLIGLDSLAKFAQDFSDEIDKKTNDKIDEAIDIDYEILAFDINEIIDGLLSPDSTLDTSQLDIMTLSGEDVSSFALEAGDSYNRQNFVPYQILRADHLNNIESGIVNLESVINNMNNNVVESIDEINTELKTKASIEFVNNMLSGLRLVQMTQSEYDALEVKDSNIFYIII